MTKQKNSREKEKASIHYATLSNTIVLVLIGFFLLLFFHINSITSIVKEKINIIVELKENTKESDAAKIIAILSANPAVIEGSAKYIPEEKAEEIMGADVIASLKDVGLPFRKMVSFNVKANDYNEETLKNITREIKKYDFVSEVFYENMIVDQVKSNLQKFSFGILSLAIIFIFLAVVIIYNTINLSMYADRWEIKTMEIIGARDNFIRQPYLKIAGKIAFRSFIMASIFIAMILVIIHLNFPTMIEIVRWHYILLTFFLILIISLTITITATVRIVNSYLYKHERDLYF